MHPFLVGVGIAGQGRAIHDPRLGFGAFVLGGEENERGSSLDEERLPGEDEFLDGRVFGTEWS